ncbi:MAG: sigma-70 family RNA polymerase sigma factor [Planctomycetes bacterium]|nr:sigma-70 family RNA polymerase sigma factor [Planctomycetota bacterium]
MVRAKSMDEKRVEKAARETILALGARGVRFSEAEDAAQEAVARVLRAVQRGRRIADLGAFVWKTALHVLSEQGRTFWKRRREFLDVTELEPPAVTSKPEMPIRLLEQMFALLAKIPEKQQDALRLAALWGWNPARAAKEIGVSAQAMRERLENARKLLRRKYLDNPIIREWLADSDYGSSQPESEVSRPRRKKR